ncbi:MAG TPA: DNA internalization-related competence protein ComEC/Rec2 [Candidatus Cloacimonas sp.]|nr:DNA internalization-related competence protein ComEC/Rec2 [Candidatus Cloacimonas sp.]HOQ77980.1 DNA internalization-related competence protein ComEC/Rec2 [Candidatus Cloacimonas sp.]HRR00202.1 DNA internalization-related competence protein ComEC/Rec2 [Candidatus Cloacimonas sp.]HRR51636.1 DNA internalization-related competence protein ComEC/Rec2 [Candidatus Cloacimonas sp.]
MEANSKAPAPFVLPVIFWIIGIILAKIIQINILFLLILASGLLILGVFCKKIRLILLIILFLVLGMLRFSIVKKESSPLALILQENEHLQQEICFTVTNVFSVEEMRYAVELDSLAGFPLQDNIILSCSEKILPGKSYCLLAEIYPLVRDPILDIYPNRYSAIGYQLGKAKSIDAKDVRDYLGRLRYKLLSSLEIKLGDQADWAKALLFGESGLKQEYINQLTEAGIIHLVVVSGMHIWLIYMIIVSFFRIFFRRELAEFLFLPSILLYASLNNWAPSVTRSIIMISIVILARWLQSPVSGAQTMALSIFIITLLSPMQLFNIGLQLSYISILVIFYGLPHFRLFAQNKILNNSVYKMLENIKEGILLSTLISIAITPFTLYYFGTASLNGIIGNIIGIPLMSIMLPLSMLVLISPQGWYITKLFVLCYKALNSLWISWIQFCHTLPFSLSANYLSLYQALALAIVILWCFLLIRSKYKTALKTLIPASLLVMGFMLIPNINKQDASIYVFNCGMGDCTLIRFQDGKTMLIDTGGGKNFGTPEAFVNEVDYQQESWLSKNLLPWLGKKGINRIDYLILTHLHNDHCGGLITLLNHKKIGHIFVSDESVKQDFWNYAQKQKYFGSAKIHTITDTCSFFIDKARLKFLHPDKNYLPHNENNASLVCRLDTKKESILFTGDIESEAEFYLVDNYAKELKANYLKIPHHGSKSSSSTEFLEAVSPQEVWITAPRKNIYRFPHPDTMQRIQKQQAKILLTGNGTIRKIGIPAKE